MITIRNNVDKALVEYGLNLDYLTPDWYDPEQSITNNIHTRIEFINEQAQLGNFQFRDELKHYLVVTNNMTVLTYRKVGLEARFLPYS